MKRKFPFPGVLLSLVGIGMMLYGICRGELGILLMKATHICLECIGIG